jgi:hypothetical protein
MYRERAISCSHEASTRGQLFRMLSSAVSLCSGVVVRILDYLRRMAPVGADVRLMVGRPLFETPPSSLALHDRPSEGESPAACSSDNRTLGCEDLANGN